MVQSKTGLLADLIKWQWHWVNWCTVDSNRIKSTKNLYKFTFLTQKTNNNVHYHLRSFTSFANKFTSWARTGCFWWFSTNKEHKLGFCLTDSFSGVTGGWAVPQKYTFEDSVAELNTKLLWLSVALNTSYKIHSLFAQSETYTIIWK